ncbi:MAG TPA: DUF1203 domain-containing protein [Allosphingosinicella sp.]|uniref:DUF1203 domain-containing protein n=1 Tax=Allosphingosinicella sp. TaxID=2823234 RepID=UPI002EDB9C99
MHFRVTGLSPEPFQHLFGLCNEELKQEGAFRYIAEQGSAFPDRVELRDAEPGETLLLVNYTHQPANTPYRASHAIFVLEHSEKPYEASNEIPPALRSRTLSLRAFDEQDMIVDGDLIEGAQAEELIERMFAQPEVAYIHAHYARRGCYAARIDRA